MPVGPSLSIYIYVSILRLLTSKDLHVLFLVCAIGGLVLIPVFMYHHLFFLLPDLVDRFIHGLLSSLSEKKEEETMESRLITKQ